MRYLYAVKVGTYVGYPHFRRQSLRRLQKSSLCNARMYVIVRNLMIKFMSSISNYLTGEAVCIGKSRIVQKERVQSGKT